MSLKKILITFILFFSVLGLSSPAFAAETKTKVSLSETFKEVDARIQAALDAIPAGDAKAVAGLIKAANEKAAELSANYKFEFERDKVMGKLRKAREAANKSDLPTADQELKGAKEGFENLKKFQ